MLEKLNLPQRLGRSVIFLAATWICGVAHAGAVYQAAITVSPQLQMEGGEVEGCGFQFKSLPTNFRTDKNPVLLDVSLVLYSGVYAGLKGGAQEIGMTGESPTSRKPLTVSSFWLKADGLKATAPLEGKVMPANDPGYLLYASDFAHGAELLYAALEGKQLWLGVHLKGEPVERIYVGIPPMAAAEKAQSQQCMVELLERANAKLKSPEPKSQRK